MDEQELERLYAAGDQAGVDAALAQRASEAGDYWAVRSPRDAEFRQFGSTPSDLGSAGELGLAGLRTTAAYGLYRYARDNTGLHTDPNFKPYDRFDELTKDVPQQYWGDIMETTSYLDYSLLMDRIKQDETDMKRFSANGPAGTAAMIGGSMFDIDLLLTPLTDGAYTAAKVARVVKNARLAKVASTALSGTMAGLAVEGTNAAVRETVDWTSVPQAALSGLIMGGALGTALPTQKMLGSHAELLRDDFHARMANDPNFDDEIFRQGAAIDPDIKNFYAAVKQRRTTAEDSVGAQRNPNRPNLGPDLIDDRQMAWVDMARDFLDTSVRSGGKASTREFEDSLRKAEDILNLGGYVGSDWYKLAKSKSSVARWLAARMLESPSGQGGRMHTAALDREMYMRRILKGIPEFQSNYVKWAQSQGGNLVDIHYKGDLAEAFGKEVHLEMNYRRLHDAESPNQNPHVKSAADAIETQAKEAYNIGKGLPGEQAVDGFDSIKYKRGYSPLKWNGYALNRAIKAGGPGTKGDIVTLVGKGYEQALGVSPDIARVFAKAVVNRAMRKAQDFDTSLQSLLTADGRAFLHERLVDNGIAKSEADKIVEGLSGPLEERGKQSFAKERTEIDLTVEHNGHRLIDYVDNNLSHTWTLYARQMSGSAALARMGITNKAMRKEIRDALIAEQNALGEEASSADFVDDVFSYFDAGPVSGGLSPTVSRLKKLANLSLLNKLGLAQGGETGAIIAAVGWENFLAHAPIVRRLLKNAEAGNTDVLLDDLGAWTGRIWDEEKLIDPEFDFSAERMNSTDQHELMYGLDRFLAKGQRLQGHVSAFFGIRKLQTKAAAAGIVDKLFRGLRDGTMDTAGRRFDDIGFGADMREKLSALVADGTIEFQPNGFIDKLNMDKWEPQLAHEFAGGITRFVHQVIQKDLIGEGSTWMHRDFGSLLTHLRQFPLLAMTKQVIRNARINDQVSKTTLLYGLMTAGLAYTASQMIEGRTDKLNPVDIAKGAMSYSNMTGFLPMLTDTTATMFGLDDWRLMRYGPYSELSLPVVDWVNKAIRVPGAVLGSVNGIDTGERSALKAMPFANMYGSAVLFNAMKE